MKPLVLFKIRINLLLVIGLATCVLPAYAVAGERSGETIETWKADFRAGSAAAAYLIGCSYQQGRGGVWRNPAEAVRWYQLGARRGDLQAALALADMYLAGEGSERSEEKAIYWYLRLGATLSEYARPARTRLLMLTRNYALGEGGVTRDEPKARDLFTRLFKMEQEGQSGLMLPEPVTTATSR